MRRVKRSQQAEDAAGRNYSSNPIRYWDAVGETAKNYEKMDTRKYTDYNTTAAKAVGGKG